MILDHTSLRLPTGMVERIVFVVERMLPDGKERVVMHLGEYSAAIVEDRPLTGAGFGQGSYLKEQPAYRASGNPSGIPRAARSVWFSVLAGTGHVGLALCIGMLGVASLIGRRIVKFGMAAGDRIGGAVNYAEGANTCLD